MSKSLGAATLLQALWMAIARRGAPEGLIFHSDRGVQYVSTRLPNVLRKKLFIQSMSRKGNCRLNAVGSTTACVESFFKSLKSELIGTTIYESRAAAMKAIFEYIELFYNGVRLHSTLDYRTRSNTRRDVRRRWHNEDRGQIVKNSPARWPVMKFSEPRWYSDTPGKR